MAELIVAALGSVHSSSILFVSAIAAFAAAFLFVFQGYPYVLRRWKISAYPLLKTKKLTPIEELHGSRDLIIKGFTKFQVSYGKVLDYDYMNLTHRCLQGVGNLENQYNNWGGSCDFPNIHSEISTWPWLQRSRIYRAGTFNGLWSLH